MFEYHEGGNNQVFEHHTFGDSDAPEPLENWSLEDFEELLPRARQ